MAKSIGSNEKYSKQLNNKMLEEYQRDKTNIELRNKIVEYNLRLVPAALKRNGGYIVDFHDYDEILQEGYLKLIRAVELYELGNGSFSSYVFATLKGLGTKRISYNTDISLNSPLSYEDEQAELIDTIEDEEANFENKLVEEKYYIHIRKQLKANLSREQFKVIQLLYGLGVEPKTMQETADTLGKTYSQVRTIKDNAFKEIRKSKYFRRYYDEHYKNISFYRSSSYFDSFKSSRTNSISKPVEAAVINLMDFENKLINEMLEKERLAAWGK